MTGRTTTWERAKGSAHYYYPGGNFGGPVPGTHKKLLFWGGFERFLQNQGNANVLSSFIPSPEMMAGDFTMDNPDNQKLCPNGFTPNPNGKYPNGAWCQDLTGTALPDGTTVTNGHVPAKLSRSRERRPWPASGPRPTLIRQLLPAT